MLTGPEIRKQIMAGRIVIDPFDVGSIGPNSVDLRLGPTLIKYELSKYTYLDMRQACPTVEIVIPDGGYVLYPGELYLGHTVERAGSDFYVPRISGRSSVGRLGMQVHMTAGEGECGFHQQWTLEITVVHPLRVYAGTRVAQVYFTRPEGEIELYQGRYKDQSGPVASRLWQGETK